MRVSAILGFTAALLVVSAAEPASGAAAAAGTAAPAGAPAKPVRLAYRYAAREIIRQTMRQTQIVMSQADPSLGGETLSVGRAEVRVIEVDPNGTAILDETVTYEEDPDRKDFKRMRTTRLGEVLWVDIVKGDPSTLEGGALFVDRPVRPGDTWPTALKGGGARAEYRISLVVTFTSLKEENGRKLAFLDMKGRMDPANVTAMLGPDAASQGLAGKECAVTGAVRFDVGAGKELSSRISLECALERTDQEGKTAPVGLSIAHETSSDGPAIPSIPSP